MEQDQRGEVLECGKVLLIGAALLDQIVHVSSDFLRENQLEANATYHCNREPRLYAVVERFERDYGHQIIRKPGGSAFNTALHYHSLYQGADDRDEAIACQIVGLVGKNDHCDWLKERAEEKQLDAIWLCNTSGNRCLVSLGGADDVTPETLLRNSEFVTSLEAAKGLYMVAFVLLHPNYWVFLFLAEKISKWNILMVFNLSSYKILESKTMKERVWDALKFSDYVIGNYEEFAAFTGIVDPYKAILYVQKRVVGSAVNGKQIVVVMTRGDKSTLTCLKEQIEEFAVKRFDANILKGDGETMLDTNGAGDAFAAGFVFGICNGRDLAQSVKLANETAFNCIKQSAV
ncbi:uncharacterized protein LOC142338713 isoform X2 [Convolutriloba macropyga]|uniref:uncharacterized protein LOC142338713 isoform X2 n=1 Tax=Convolutriloba macropyga TaxID=536237 RepID=UPI003F52093D